MEKKKPDVDVIEKVLDACYKANPDALFVMSLMHQYEERGSLSKKQLQGLFEKAKKVRDLPPNLLATLEARILKMPTRNKALPDLEKVKAAPFTKDAHAGALINDILTRYPQHKRVLFLKSRYDNNEVLSPSEVSELEKFGKILLK
ncbi:hypothetical protein [Filimonas effusa]|uniref:Uncharacterized protein n=1 Tax=Filimonas effusa TaxID=2508721 RepID=A0A4Q1D207_9BACT|nr:hypothetical protein [Filimonas effusa]RXK81039.1 hypothetical protein ESB13_23075 [Filimonas effusa]